MIEYVGVLYTIYRDCSKSEKIEFIKKYKGVARGPVCPKGISNFNADFIADGPHTIKHTYLQFLDINDPESCVPYSDNYFLLEENDELARKMFVDAATERAYVLYERYKKAEAKYEEAVGKIKTIEQVEIIDTRSAITNFKQMIKSD